MRRPIPSGLWRWVIARATAASFPELRRVGGVETVVPADFHLRGCPPRPVDLLRGLLALLEPNGGGNAGCSGRKRHNPVSAIRMI